MRIAIDMEQVWNVGFATRFEIPKYLDENPDVERALGLRPTDGSPLAEVFGRSVACTAVHTPVPSGSSSYER